MIGIDEFFHNIFPVTTQAPQPPTTVKPRPPGKVNNLCFFVKHRFK